MDTADEILGAGRLGDVEQIDAVEAEVAAAVEDYDDALSSGDLERVDRWFWRDDRVSRFGESDSIRGFDNIAAARRSGAARSSNKTDEQRRIVVLSQDAAVTTSEYRRADSGRRGRRTQVWRRTPEGWRIFHAHLSLEA